MNTFISNATKRNWIRLNANVEDRLTKRANKRNSQKKVIPVEYFTDAENILFIQNLKEKIETNSWEIKHVLYSISILMLEKKGILNKPHVQSVLKEYDADTILEISNMEVPLNEWDLLGLIYQSVLLEGKKNILGSYYTPKSIAENMTKEFDFSNEQLFLDPCCGSGAFLLAVDCHSPKQLYGCDNDPIAVIIAKINLLLKYPDYEFEPQIYCLDYLFQNSFFSYSNIISSIYFDYIATNPPWGAVSLYDQMPIEISSKESFSCFFVNAFKQLKENGTIRFLFPESILNVKIHSDIRNFMLDFCCIEQITTYDNAFSGVTTKYIDIFCKKSKAKDSVLVCDKHGTRKFQISCFRKTENNVFSFLSNTDIEIINTINIRGKYNLSESTWALGIVTGDNKNKLKSSPQNGFEKIYTGKEIARYFLMPPKNYLHYNRSDLQQVAKDEYYRANEKLVYKFISNKLVFAYDNTKSLFLNSANILIPNIPGMSIKTVMAFLNSELFQFYYYNMFGEIKILKGNLNELPFPDVTKEQNQFFEEKIDEILKGNIKQDELVQNKIFELYNFSKEQVQYIRSNINGTLS